MPGWGAAFAEGLSLFSKLSTSLRCPAHCYPSSILPLLSGVTLGLAIGFPLGLWVSWTFLRANLVTPVFASPPSPGETAVHRRPASRLRGYLHE